MMNIINDKITILAPVFANYYLNPGFIKATRNKINITTIFCYIIVFLIPFRNVTWLCLKHSSLHLINILIIITFLYLLLSSYAKKVIIFPREFTSIIFYIVYILFIGMVYSRFYSTIEETLFYDLVISSFMIPIISWTIVSIRKLRLLIGIISFSSAIQLLLGFLQYYFGSKFYITRFSETHSHILNAFVGSYNGTGQLAEFLLLSYCIFFSLFLTNMFFKPRTLFYLSLTAIGILLIGSRVTIFGVLLLPLAILIIIKRISMCKIKMSKKFISVFAISLLFAIVTFSLTSVNELDYIVNKSKRLLEPTERREGLLGERSAINKAALNMILFNYNNIILGNGFNTFSRSSYNFIYKITDRQDIVYKNIEAHNQYAKVLFEDGILGLMFFLIPLIIGFKNFRFTLYHYKAKKIYNVYFLAILVSTFVFYIYFVFMMFFGYGVWYHLMLALSFSAMLKNIITNKYTIPHSQLTTPLT